MAKIPALTEDAFPVTPPTTAFLVLRLKPNPFYLCPSLPTGCPQPPPSILSSPTWGPGARGRTQGLRCYADGASGLPRALLLSLTLPTSPGHREGRWELPGRDEETGPNKPVDPSAPASPFHAASWVLPCNPSLGNQEEARSQRNMDHKPMTQAMSSLPPLPSFPVPCTRGRDYGGNSTTTWNHS